MASSMSEQGELIPAACKMIGYVSRRDGAILLPCDFPLSPARKPFLGGSHVISSLSSLFDQDGLRPWPCSFFCGFMDLDSISVHKHAKKNLANIQPS